MMPMPSGRKMFSYPPTDTPIRSTAPSKAKPVGVELAGRRLNMRVSVGEFPKPVNVYLTLQVPSEDDEDDTDSDSGHAYTLGPDNRFRRLEDDRTIGKPWKSNITDINQDVLSRIPMSELPEGHYVVTLTVRPSDNRSVYYKWMTYFLVD